MVISGGRSVLQAPLERMLAERADSSLEDIYLELTGNPEGDSS